MPSCNEMNATITVDILGIEAVREALDKYAKKLAELALEGALAPQKRARKIAQSKAPPIQRGRAIDLTGQAFKACGDR